MCGCEYCGKENKNISYIINIYFYWDKKNVNFEQRKCKRTRVSQIWWEGDRGPISVGKRVPITSALKLNHKCNDGQIISFTFYNILPYFLSPLSIFLFPLSLSLFLSPLCPIKKDIFFIRLKYHGKLQNSPFKVL